MSTKAQPASARAATGKRFRLAVYDVLDDQVPLDFVGRVLGSCDDDQEYAREAISQYGAYVARLPSCTLAMGLFEV